MKKSFSSTAAVCHKFAERSQSSGYSSNVFFENTDKIYSYGYHFLLGEFKVNKNSEIAIILNNASYSSSTRKHQSCLWQATRQYKQISSSHYWKSQIIPKLEENRIKLSKARKPEIYINDSTYIINQYKENCNWFGETCDAEILEYENIFNIENYKQELLKFDAKKLEQYEKRKIEDEKRRKKALKLAKIKLEEDVVKFYNYEISYIRNNFNNHDYCRLNLDKTIVETSQGVTVPIREAKILYNKILKFENIHGFRIGNYIVDSINGVLKVGCHNIVIDSVHKVGQQLLLLND